MLAAQEVLRELNKAKRSARQVRNLLQQRYT